MTILKKDDDAPTQLKPPTVGESEIKSLSPLKPASENGEPLKSLSPLKKDEGGPDGGKEGKKEETSQDKPDGDKDGIKDEAGEGKKTAQPGKASLGKGGKPKKGGKKPLPGKGAGAGKPPVKSAGGSGAGGAKGKVAKPVPTHGVTNTQFIKLRDQKKKKVLTIIFSATGIITILLCIVFIQLQRSSKSTPDPTPPPRPRQQVRQPSSGDGGGPSAPGTQTMNELTATYINFSRTDLIRNPNSIEHIDSNIRKLRQFLEENSDQKDSDGYKRAKAHIEQLRKARELYQ